MEIKEHGVCIVAVESKWGPNTVGIVEFKEKYDVPPEVQLTASEEGRPIDWAMIACSVLEVTTTNLVIDFDGWKEVEGELKFQQRVFPGAKCYWAVI
jgi:hypothetical protein